MASPFSTTYRNVAFIAAGAAGAAACYFMRESHFTTLASTFVGDLAATVTVFGFSYAANNSCVYDAYWPVAPVPIAAYWLSLNPRPSTAAYTAAGLLAIWSVRYLSIEDPSSKVNHEDWRYADFRAKTRSAYWPISLFSFHLTPTAVVFLALSPLYPLLSGRFAPLRLDYPYLFWGSAALTAGAIVFQSVADHQLKEFRKTSSADSVLETGLWAYTRHPNYFGECSFWLGVLGMGLSHGVERWMCAGAAAMFAMFRFASIPLMDARLLQRRPRYAATMSRVSAFLPWPRAAGSVRID